MAKYIVETYYTCSFKVKHYLDDISNNQLDQLDKRNDGEFEVLDVKFDKRNTKNLEKKTDKIEVKYEEHSEKVNSNNLPNRILFSQSTGKMPWGSQISENELFIPGKGPIGEKIVEFSLSNNIEITNIDGSI